ncbi:MAG: aldehyde oxidase, partial [Deltaproteobacteria bacterium]
MSSQPDDVVGRKGRRIDVARRVRGDVRYTDDVKLPRTLAGKLVRSTQPHARIVSIDASRALALEGVAAVITGQDLSAHFGILPWTPDETPLCVDRVRFVGDAVCAVAASDERTAARAAALVRIEYESLPAAVELDVAITHPEIGLGATGRDNVSKHVDLAFGDVDGGLAAAHVLVEGEYFFEGSAHAPLETH